MSYEMKVKAKDVCEKVLFIICRNKETKKYDLSKQKYIINLLKEVKTFEGNIKNVYGIIGIYDKISFKNIPSGDEDIIEDKYYITFVFDNEEDLFYFQLKSNAEIFEVKEIK